MKEASLPATLGSQLFYEAFKASPVGIALEDLEGRPLFVNPALCSMLGLSQEEMLGRRYVGFSPPADAQQDWVLFEQLRTGSIDHYYLDKRLFRKDGSLAWGRLSASLLPHHTPPMVFVLVQDLTQEKKAQEELQRLQEEEHRALKTLEMVTQQMAGAVTQASRDFRYLWANKGYAEWLQLPLDHIVGRPVADVLGRQAFEALRPYFERVLSGQKVHYEQQVNYQYAGPKWISATYTPTFDEIGVVNGWVAVVTDITERKRAEEALSTVSQKLIEAQEQERSRLARELHDDINQRLALLAVNLNGLKQSVWSSADELRREIDKASRQVVDLGNDIQGLSHRLHSPKLDLLGLGAAAKGFCREFADLQKVEIGFHSENVPKDLPHDLSLCLFRVLQEALLNASKHSGSRHFEVSLTGEAKEIELTVRDSGIGFDPGKTVEGRGLGLTSMRERLRLCGGQLSIESKPHGGTTVRARVPICNRTMLASVPLRLGTS